MGASRERSPVPQSPQQDYRGFLPAPQSYPCARSSEIRISSKPPPQIIPAVLQRSGSQIAPASAKIAARAAAATAILILVVTAALPQPSLDWISGSLRNEEIAFAGAGHILRHRSRRAGCTKKSGSRRGLFLLPRPARRLRPGRRFERRRLVHCLLLLQPRRPQSRISGLRDLRAERDRARQHAGLQQPLGLPAT